MKNLLLVLAALTGVVSAPAQSIIFDDVATAGDFSYHKDESHIICFYKTWNSSTTRSYFRSVVLNSNLELTDTINYSFPGERSTIVSGENDRYGYHIFHTRFPGREVISFVITDPAGKILATYEKNAADLKLLTDKKVKPGQLRFRVFATSGADAETLVLEPSYYGSGGAPRWSSPVVALNMLDGSLKWKLNNKLWMFNPVCIRGKFVAVIPDRNNLNILHSFSLRTGQELSSFQLSPPRRARTLSVMAVNDSSVLVGGTDTDRSDQSNKHARFYLTKFDYTGNRIFDRIDTVERLPGNRLEMVGGTFTPDGNAVVIGESYRVDATKVVAGVAASVALSVLTGSYINTGGRVERIVENVVSARISPSGAVTEFHAFPVEKRKTFSSLIVDHRQVYLRNGNQLLWYNLDDLSTKPRKFTALQTGDEVFTLYGNLIGIRMNEKNREIMLAVIPGE